MGKRGSGGAPYPGARTDPAQLPLREVPPAAVLGEGGRRRAPGFLHRSCSSSSGHCLRQRGTEAGRSGVLPDRASNARQLLHRQGRCQGRLFTVERKARVWGREDRRAVRRAPQAGASARRGFEAASKDMRFRTPTAELGRPQEHGPNYPGLPPVWS